MISSLNNTLVIAGFGLIIGIVLEIYLWFQDKEKVQLAWAIITALALIISLILVIVYTPVAINWVVLFLSFFAGQLLCFWYLDDKKKGSGSITYLIIFLFPFVIFGVIGMSFYAIIKYLHYSLGLLLAFFLLAGSLGIISWLNRSIQTERKSESPLGFDVMFLQTSSSLEIIFILVAIGAWLSYSLYDLKLVKLLEGSGEPTYWNLIQTYLWHLFDTIPFTNVEKTFGMKDPIVQFIGWIAGLPFLAFRFAVVIVVFAAVRESWKTFQEATQKAFEQRMKERVKTEQSVEKADDMGAEK
jgi:hypothetical protein